MRFAPFTFTKVTMFAVLLLVAMVPLFDYFFGTGFYLDVGTRLACLAIAAIGLNLAVGYGGMISFGHAAFIGIGAYSVGIPTYYGIDNGFVHLALAITSSALFALVTGAISLRTRGVYFIMITLAFAQMVYFAFVSIEEYGGDDGLVIETRSDFMGLPSLENNLTLFIFCYLSLLVILFLIHRLSRSRFGLVLRGAKDNERRLQAMGYSTFGYQLTAYVISGVICGYAGALLGNFTNFITPEMMDWTRSGELLFMVALGGVGTLSGPLLGAVAIVVLEELFSTWTVYWQFFLGLTLIVTVLYASGGINGILSRWGFSNE